MALDCLVINLTRFGDLIQSQPLLHDLANAGLRTGLVCQENFVKTTELLSGLARVWALPGAHLLKDLDCSWKEAFYRLRSFCDDIRRTEDIRSVLNITPTIAARLLANLLAPSPNAIVGFGIDDEGFGINTGTWATFFSAASACRQNAVFNIGDMFRNMGNPLLGKGRIWDTKDLLLTQPSDESQQAAKDLLATCTRPPKKAIQGYIAFQLGASARIRQWPIAYFAKLGDMLWESGGFCPVLTGAKSELPFVTTYAKESHGPFISAVGKTSLPVLQALLQRMRLLVSNDTGTLHLASASHTKSVSFFLATAQPWDTGPLLPGCLCLEPDIDCHPCAFNAPCTHDTICQQQIRPEAVAQILLSWLSGKTWAESVALAQPLSARIWETSVDQNNRAYIKALSKHAYDNRTLWIHYQRDFWSQLLDNTRTKLAALSTPTTCQKNNKFFVDICAVLTQANVLLSAICEQISLLGKSQNAGTLVLRNCDRLQTLFMSSQHLTSFGYYWRELRLDQGNNLQRLSENIRRFQQSLASLRATLERHTKI